MVLRDPNSVIGGQSGIDMPGGKYRWGANLEEELRREVREETSLEIEVDKPIVVYTYYGDRRKSGISSHTVLVGYLCKYKSGKVVLSDEHDDYEWVDKTTYEKWADKTETYKAVKKFFLGT